LISTAFIVLCRGRFWCEFGAATRSDLATLMSDDINSVGGKNITAMTLWSWHRVYGAALARAVPPRCAMG
jgi:hypothetical protein